jgi:transposase
MLTDERWAALEPLIKACRPHASRRLVENLWARLKEWRAVATRCEKTGCSFLRVPHFTAAALDWLRG